jgi:hypothetical protein
VGADLFKAGRFAPVTEVLGDKSKKFFLFFRELHVLLLGNQQNLQFLNKNTVSFYESQDKKTEF